MSETVNSGDLTLSECEQIETILSRRANEIAIYSEDNRGKIPASVEYALELEIKRLRGLSVKMSLLKLVVEKGAVKANP